MEAYKTKLTQSLHRPSLVPIHASTGTTPTEDHPRRLNHLIPPHMPDRPARHFDQHLSADMQQEFPGVHKVTFPLDRVPASRNVFGNVRHAPHSSEKIWRVYAFDAGCTASRGGVDSMVVPCKVLFDFFLFGFFATKVYTYAVRGI